MVPIEFTFYIIGFTVILIGFARGYAKGLGTTMIAMTAIFVLSIVETQVLEFPQVKRIVDLASTQLLGDPSTENVNFLLCLVFFTVYILIIFAGYSGQTLEFPGEPAPPPQGTILSLFVSVINGYLVAGTLWYFLHHYNYPIQWLVDFQRPLTTTAQIIVDYLPQNLIDSSSGLGAVIWMIPVALLLLLRVRG